MLPTWVCESDTSHSFSALRDHLDSKGPLDPKDQSGDRFVWHLFVSFYLSCVCNSSRNKLLFSVYAGDAQGPSGRPGMTGQPGGVGEKVSLYSTCCSIYLDVWRFVLYMIQFWCLLVKIGISVFIIYSAYLIILKLYCNNVVIVHIFMCFYECWIIRLVTMCIILSIEIWYIE